MEAMPNDISPVVPIIVGVVWLLVVAAMSVFFAVVYCKICSKAGYHWAIGLLMFVPIANIILPCVLAFAEWPIQKELRGMRQIPQAPPPRENFRGM